MTAVAHRSEHDLQLIHEINLGATAIGTGLNAPAGYAESVRRHLSQITGLSLSSGTPSPKSVTHLQRACLALAERCVAGITANTQAMRAAVENSIGLVTALNPYIGYEAATGIAKEALATGRGVAELVLDKGLLPAGDLAGPLRPEAVAGPGQALV
jgi:aspartate ammonia-lyase